jgi:tetratricopeptide (TPR) repeat protein
MRQPKPGILFLGIVIILIGMSSPASAYSDEAIHWFEEGNAFVLAKDYSPAVGAFDKAIALEPGYFEAIDAKADALNRAGEFSKALDASSQTLTVNPGYVQGWINRGQILYNIGYNYEDQMNNPVKAEEYYREQLLAFEKAIELDPENAEAWFNKGYALAGMKQYDSAVAAFEKVKTLDPGYPNLDLNLKQAQVLRDAATPVYVKYSLPLIGGFLLIIIIGGIIWYRQSSCSKAEEPVPENRQARRKKGK